MGRINAAARYRELGDELRKRREAAGLSGVEMARRMGCSRATLSRMELGQHEVSPVEMVHYLGECGIYRGQALDLLAMCRAAAEGSHGYWLSLHDPGQEDRLCSLVYHESTASATTCYEPQVVPGLLQTESYIRAMTALRWPHRDVDLAVRIRLERQRILHRPSPARFTFFVSERAFRLKFGDSAVMHEQLLALTLLDGLPHVAIRVLPEPAAFGGPFRVLEYGKHSPLVYLDAYVGGFFLEDKEYIDPYRDLVPVIADAALDEAQSREYVATLADEYDRGSAREHVEEEQLQR